MHRRLPILAVILSAGGLVPFVMCGLGAVATNTITSLPAANLLIAYGAIVLSFLGGVHWGLTLATEHDPAERQRLVGGVAPAVLAWAVVAVSMYTLQPSLGIALLIALFILAAGAEWRAHHLGLVPGGYIGLRIVMTVIVVAILTTVLMLRLIGGHLIF
jgi:hypothetical protein